MNAAGNSAPLGTPRIGGAALGFWVVTAVGAIGAAVLFFVNPAATALFPRCLFHELTALYCPGCGTSRALHALLHLELGTALQLNPLATLAAPLLGWAWLSRAFRLIRLPELPQLPARPILLWGLAATVILFGLLRNLPFYPFNLLAPGG